MLLLASVSNKYINKVYAKAINNMYHNEIKKLSHLYELH